MLIYFSNNIVNYLAPTCNRREQIYLAVVSSVVSGFYGSKAKLP